MNELKFNSQICTTKEQSQRLLDLGLKPETADISIITTPIDCDGIKYSLIPYSKINHPKVFGAIPAWSLHRLIEILPSEIKQIDGYYNLISEKNVIQYEDYGIDVLKSFRKSPNIYDNIVDCIEWLIKEGYFNQEYLKQ